MLESCSMVVLAAGEALSAVLSFFTGVACRKGTTSTTVSSPEDEPGGETGDGANFFATTMLEDITFFSTLSM